MDSLLGHRILHAIANPAVWGTCGGGATAANGTIDCWLDLEPLAREEPVLADVAALGVGLLPCDWSMEQACRVAVNVLFDHCLALYGRHCEEQSAMPDQNTLRFHSFRKVRNCQLEPSRLVFQIDLHWVEILLLEALGIPPLRGAPLGPCVLGALAQGYRKALRTADCQLSREILLESLLHGLQRTRMYPEWPWRELHALVPDVPSVREALLRSPQTAVTCPVLGSPRIETLINDGASAPEFVRALLPEDPGMPEFRRTIDDACRRDEAERQAQREAEGRRRGHHPPQGRGRQPQVLGPETPTEDLFQEETPRHKLDDVVLPSATRDQVAVLAQAITHRAVVLDKWGLGEHFGYGHGLTALFEGPSGTGKTHCARALAGELSFRLVTVNLAQIENRFVGESEKNLQRIFGEADSETILFFDEADAFFTHRSDSDVPMASHVNRMVCVLLCEMERFNGTLILATNRALVLDPAFERRIAYRVRFPYPDVEQRNRIWQNMLGIGSLPVAGDVDVDELANTYDLNGGQIKTVVLNAAFAAAKGGCLTMDHLRKAASCNVSTPKAAPIGFGR